MRDIRFALEPGLMGSHSLESGCGKTVPDVDLSIECFPPQRRRQFCFVQHGRDVFSHGAISSFCNAVLLWPVARRVAPMDAAFVSELEESIGHELSAFVVLQLLDFGL